MPISQETVDARTRLVAAEGELLGSSGRRLIEVVQGHLEAGAKRIVIDLTEMTFLDSGGLAGLIGAWDLTGQRRAQMTLVIPQGAHVLRTLETRGIGGLFRIARTREEALAARGLSAAD